MHVSVHRSEAQVDASPYPGTVASIPSVADHGDKLTSVLADVLVATLGEGVEPSGVTHLSGGASRQTWSLDAIRPDGTVERLVLRQDHPGAPPSGLLLEAALLEAAKTTGVPVPDVVATGTMSSLAAADSDPDGDSDDDGAGVAYILMRFVEGETIPKRILNDVRLAGARHLLASQCGTALAAIHRIPPSEAPGLPDGDPLEQLNDLLESLGEPHPALELGLRWLAVHRPPLRVETVVHGDFRNGNLIVGPGGLRAVIDWELAHVSDPLEDLGWLCAKAWRFGSKLPVGGFGTVDQLVDAYESAGGVVVDRAALGWWEMFGTLRWGVICIVQAMTHLTGVMRSVELAAIGRRVSEVEWDILAMLR